MTAARYNIGVLASNVLRFRRAMFCCCGNSFVLFSVCLYFIEFYVRKKFIASKFYGGWIIFSFFFWKPKLVCNWERLKLICNSTMGALNLYKWTRVLCFRGKYLPKPTLEKFSVYRRCILAFLFNQSKFFHGKVFERFVISFLVLKGSRWLVQLQTFVELKAEIASRKEQSELMMRLGVNHSEPDW